MLVSRLRVFERELALKCRWDLRELIIDPVEELCCSLITLLNMQLDQIPLLYLLFQREDL